MVQLVDTVVLETMGEILKSSNLFIPTINNEWLRDSEKVS